jgi:hypothetical protein
MRRETMLADIKRAESAIKAGDTRTAFEILREVLAENPNSERAWWIMSGLVPREQRAHCLNEVLRINPENKLARETLLTLTPQPPSPTTTASTSETREKKTWFYTRGSRLYVTIITDDGILHAQSDSNLKGPLQAAIQEGKLPDNLIKSKTAIPFRNVQSTFQMMSSFRVNFLAQGKEESIRLELADTESAEEVLEVVEKKLGDNFVRTTAPMKKGSALAISAILTLGAAGITAFFYWGALEVASGRAAATGSIRTRSIINLLDMLGPTGVAIIGGILILIALGISIRVLSKPPDITELVRK